MALEIDTAMAMSNPKGISWVDVMAVFEYKNDTSDEEDISDEDDISTLLSDVRTLLLPSRYILPHSDVVCIVRMKARS